MAYSKTLDCMTRTTKHRALTAVISLPVPVLETQTMPLTNYLDNAYSREHTRPLFAEHVGRSVATSSDSNVVVVAAPLKTLGADRALGGHVYVYVR